MLRTLAFQSLLSRRKTVILTYLSLLVSISVLISVEHLRAEAKESFNRSIAGTDLIVGAPTGELNLLLYSVFRMGSPTNNIQYSSFEMLKDHRSVAWAIPMSLGDSHRGYRVLGTTNAYFDHFSYGDKRKLSFRKGKELSTLFDVVLGAEVALELGYSLGDNVVISHGIGSTSFHNHDHAPFSIVGILEPTGTSVDKTVHVSLKAIEAIHLPPSQLTQVLDDGLVEYLNPSSITSVLLGLENKFATFALQRQINNFADDRLIAVLPGVAMTQLWQLMGNLESLLRVISLLVLLASLFGLTTMLLASMNERRNEISVLRMIGASPITLFKLIVYEAVFITLFASISALLLVSASFFMLSDWLVANYGLFLSGNILTVEILLMFAFIMMTVVIAALMPAIEAYRSGLNSQLAN